RLMVSDDKAVPRSHAEPLTREEKNIGIGLRLPNFRRDPDAFLRNHLVESGRANLSPLSFASSVGDDAKIDEGRERAQRVEETVIRLEPVRDLDTKHGHRHWLDGMSLPGIEKRLPIPVTAGIETEEFRAHRRLDEAIMDP